MKSFKNFLLIVIILVVANVAFGQGCSQCKLLAEQGSELDEASFGTNINYGILYLMVLPYLLIMFLFRKKIFNLFKALVKK